jgi:hypothetical protein
MDISFEHTTGKKCTKCNGIWMTFSEVKELYDSCIMTVPSKVYGDGLVAIDCPNQKSSLFCPEDKNLLFTYKYRDIEIDICKSCKGLWMDEGEFEKLRIKNSGFSEILPWIPDFFGRIMEV